MAAQEANVETGSALLSGEPASFPGKFVSVALLKRAVKHMGKLLWEPIPVEVYDEIEADIKSLKQIIEPRT